MGKPRMTLHSLLVLKVFANDPLDEHYGLEICRTAGLPGGKIDPVAAGRRPRRLYRLTPSGAEQARQALTEAQQTLFTPPIPGPRPEPA
jgi:PadR family transcriptional regulator, regulatory protein PadR